MENKDTIVQYSTEKADVLFVMVLDDADFFLIVPNSFFYDTDNKEDIRIEIPDGDWQHLGTLGNLTEQQAGLIVDGNNGLEDSTMWMHYGRQGKFAPFVKLDRVSSLQSLADHLSVYAVNPLGEIPDYKEYVPAYLSDNFNKRNKQEEFDMALSEWETTEARTGRWEVLYSPKK